MKTKTTLSVFYIVLLLLPFYIKAQLLSYQPTGSYNILNSVYTSQISVAAQELTGSGITFNANGTKMYVIGSASDQVREYNLATAYDVSTAVYFQGFSVAGQDTVPQGVSFNPSGNRMFVVGSTNDRVYQYNLGTAFNVSTAVYSTFISVAAQDTNSTGVTFNYAGTKMFVVGSTNDRVYEYNLGTAYSVATAVYSQFFSVAAQDNVPTGVLFNTNGTKMYIIGTQRDRINEYNLATAYNISTAVFSQFFLMSSQDGTPSDIAFNTSGTKVYMIGQTNDRVNEYKVVPDANLNFTETGANTGAVSGSLSIVLAGDTFKSPIINTTDVVIGGVSAGLTPSYALSVGNTVLTVTFTGSATSHANANDVANLTFTFNNSAFIGGNAAIVTNATGAYNCGMGIDFRDPDAKTAYYQSNSAFNVSTTAYTQLFSIAAQELTGTGVTFNSTGTKMYIIGTTSDQVREYNLSTAYDVSTAVYFQGISVVAQDATPQGITFSNTGTKMFMIGSTNDRVYEYTLSTAYNVSTAVYTQFFSVAAQDTNPTGITFNSNGSKMFVVGSTNDRVYEYNLSAPYNVSTAVYSQLFSVAAQDNVPTDVVFNTSGTKMYIIGTQNDQIREYNLATAYNIATAVFSQFFSMTTQDGTPHGIAFNTSGTKVYMIGQTNDRVNEYKVVPDANLNFTETAANTGAVSNSLSIVLVGDTFKNPIINTTDVVIGGISAGLTPSYALGVGNTVLTVTLTGSAAAHANANDVANLTFTFNNSAFTGGNAATVSNATGAYNCGMGIDFRDPDAKAVYYQPNGAFNVSTTSYTQLFSIAAQDNTPTGVTFNASGTKMFIIGTQNRVVREYNLATAFNVSTAVYSQGISVNAQDTAPQGVVFNPTGTKMYVVGSTNDRVYEYTLAVAYNVFTAVYTQFFSVTAQDTNPTGITFNSNGSKMFVVGSTNDRVYEYNLSAPYDISTAVYAQFFSVTVQDNTPTDVVFNTNGTKMYIIGTQRDRINEYNLATAYNIATAVFSQFFLMTTQDGTPHGIAFNTSGTKAYMIGQTNDQVNEYNIVAPLNLNYIETQINNGTVSGSLNITLIGDTFKNPIVNTTDVVIGGISAGLTPSYALSVGNTILTVTLTGSATAHENINDVANLTFTFNNTAFIGGNAAAVTNATGAYNCGMGIDFRDTPTSKLTYVPDGGYNISTTSYTQLFSVAAQDNVPTGVTFNTDGSKMYVIGTQNDQVREYNLSTPYNVATAVYAQGFSVNAQDSAPQGVVFNSLGTKMFMIGSGSSRVHEYNLSTAFNVSTAIYNTFISVSAQDTTPTGLTFNNDGSRMFVVGSTNDRVYEYNLGTAFSVGTAVYSRNFSVTTQETGPQDVIFNPNGTKMYVIGTASDQVREYNLATAFNVTTAVYAQGFSMNAQDGTPNGIAFNQNGTKIFMTGSGNDRVNEYQVVTAANQKFLENVLNNGSVTSSLTIYLNVGTFQDTNNDDILDVGSEVFLTNVPAGLTPVMTLSNGDTVVTLTFTGSATSHQNSDDVATLLFNFDNTAFSAGGAASVDNATGPFSSGIGIDFNDNLPGPGGVFSGLSHWLRADTNVYSDIAGTIVANDGDVINVWKNNQSANFNLTLTAGSSDPNFIDGALNYNPVIDFDGNDALRNSAAETLALIVDRATNNNSFFSVHNITSVSGTVIGGYEGTDGTSRAGYFALNGTAQQAAYGSATLNQTGTATITNQYIIANQSVATATGQLYINGATDGAAVAFNTLASASATGRFSLGARPTLANYSTVKVAEYFSYGRTLTATERQKVNTYLAIKYGITLSHNYLAANGSTIYDVSTFGTDIAGIGNESFLSFLDQKQSKTINTPDAITISTEAIATTNVLNGTSVPLGAYLIWGTNGGDLNTSGVSNTTNLGNGSTSFTTINRKWKITESGSDVPSVLISIPQTSIETGFPKTASEEYLLIVSSTSAFLNADIIDAVSFKLNGTNYETNYDFDGTKYFSIALASTLTSNSTLSLGAGKYLVGSNNIDLNSSFSTSFWVNNTSGGTVLAKGTDYKIDITASRTIQVSWNGAIRATSTTALTNGIWSHIAITYSGGIIKIYIDGVLDTTIAALPSPIAGTNTFSIGALYNNKSSVTNAFTGLIDEVVIWDVELTMNQIRYIMNQELIKHTDNTVTGKIIPQTITKNNISSVSWADLKVYYDFNSFYGTSIKDNSDNNNWLSINYLTSEKSIATAQTAPLPYTSTTTGLWSASATWSNGAQQRLPNSISIVDGTTPIDWNIVTTNHDITINSNRNFLSLIINAGKITVDADNGLTVTHYLKLDGIIDLVGESQLVQTTDSDLDATSSGYLEKDQQGTANAFTFNYWGSPVSLQNNTTNNTNYTLANILNDGTDPLNPQPITFITGLNGNATTSPKSITSRWLYQYHSTAWTKIDENTPISAGEGFTMKGADTAASAATDQNYVFIGKPNNGTIALPATAEIQYLIGNPYPSTIDANEFLTDNAATIRGDLYFWEHWGGSSHSQGAYQGGYAVYNLVGGLPAADFQTGASSGIKTPERYIPVSQGFFVKALNNGSIIFENDQRFYTPEPVQSVFFKGKTKSNKALSTPKYYIGFNGAGGIHRQILLATIEGTTTGHDWGYDAQLNETQIEDMTWYFNDKKYLIQSIPEINSATVLDLWVKASADGNITISLEKTENIDSSQKIFLRDSVLGKTVDLTLENYDVILTKGEHLNRFSIVFDKNNSLALETNFKSKDDDISIIYNKSNKCIAINNLTNNNISELTIINTLGQIVMQKNLDIHYNQSECISTPDIIDGFYIVKIKTGDSYKTKKILIR